MLTLTRKVGESICIGDGIRVVVKEIKGKQVRLGIIAPREVYVCREELYDKIHEANVEATGADMNILDALSDLFSTPDTEDE
ncbi:carbon storage regulator CsrA [Myxococcota bacterium]|nr:carbon storage regulator CsrA [Myxococcota bacterium]MBU1429383.1 carbon storage regulator CsrA [Myxococcota bacterium]MBU1899242.1 carbon storage regulator CsrA [Myxococcota bacterium]